MKSKNISEVFANNIRFRNDIGLQRNCHRPHGKPEQILDCPCLYYVLELQPFFEGNLVLLKNIINNDKYFRVVQIIFFIGMQEKTRDLALIFLYGLEKKPKS